MTWTRVVFEGAYLYFHRKNLHHLSFILHFQNLFIASFGASYSSILHRRVVYCAGNNFELSSAPLSAPGAFAYGKSENGDERKACIVRPRDSFTETNLRRKDVKTTSAQLEPRFRESVTMARGSTSYHIQQPRSFCLFSFSKVAYIVRIRAPKPTGLLTPESRTALAPAGAITPQAILGKPLNLHIRPARPILEAST